MDHAGGRRRAELSQHVGALGPPPLRAPQSRTRLPAMMIARRLLAFMPLALLSACATPAMHGTASNAKPVYPSSEGDSAYGLFLAGQSAINNGRGNTAGAH